MDAMANTIHHTADVTDVGTSYTEVCVREVVHTACADGITHPKLIGTTTISHIRDR